MFSGASLPIGKSSGPSRSAALAVAAMLPGVQIVVVQLFVDNPIRRSMAPVPAGSCCAFVGGLGADIGLRL